MIGNAEKPAEGFLDPHSTEVVINKDFILSFAQETECTAGQIEGISKMTLANYQTDTPDISHPHPLQYGGQN